VSTTGGASASIWLFLLAFIARSFSRLDFPAAARFWTTSVADESLISREGLAAAAGLAAAFGLVPGLSTANTAPDLDVLPPV